MVSAVILISLNYMIYLETKENERQLKEDYFMTILVSLLLTTITLFLILFAPRGISI